MDVFGMDGKTEPYQTVTGDTYYQKPTPCGCEHCKRQREAAPRYGVHGEIVGYGPELARPY